MGGWASGATDDNYGSGLRASTLARDIEAVRYEGLNLSHLYLRLAEVGFEAGCTKWGG